MMRLSLAAVLCRVAFGVCIASPAEVVICIDQFGAVENATVHGTAVKLTLATTMSDCTVDSGVIERISTGARIENTLHCPLGPATRTTTFSFGSRGSAFDIAISITSNNAIWGPNSTDTTMTIHGLPISNNVVWLPYASSIDGQTSAAWPNSVLEPFSPLKRPMGLTYGVPPVVPGETKGEGVEVGVLPVPVVTAVVGECSISLCASTEHKSVGMNVFVEGEGDGEGEGEGESEGVLTVRYQQTHRILPQQWTYHLHVGDRHRDGFAWYIARYKEFFDPPNANTFSGTVQYMDYRGQDPYKGFLKEMGAGVYWDATFPFPFWGLFVGGRDAPDGTVEEVDEYDLCLSVGHGDDGSGIWHPEKHLSPPKGTPLDGPWKDCGIGSCERVSYSTVAGWYDDARSQGLTPLSYMNLNDWGYSVDLAFNASSCPRENITAYCMANRLYQAFSDAESHVTPRTSTCNCWDGPVWNGICGTDGIAPGNRLLDPGVSERYRAYILSMMRIMLQRTRSGGICIDRSDHSAQMWPTAAGQANPDGISWYNSSAGRSFLWGYVQTTKELSAMAAEYNASVFNSPTNKRIDQLRYIDGFYDEFGDNAVQAVAGAYIGVHKVVASWDHGLDEVPHIGNTSRDAYLQFRLFLGVLPTFPSDDADHSLTVGEVGGIRTQRMHPGWSAAQILALYRDYAAMFLLFKQKRMLLDHYPSVNGTHLWVNVFNTSSGIVVPITGGTSYDTMPASTLLTMDPPLSPLSAELFHPGAGGGVPFALPQNASGPYTVPLLRGCAVLRFRF